MRYALLIYCDEDTAVSDRDRQRRQKQCTATCDRLRARGVLTDSQLLLPSRAARVVRCWDGGDFIVTDGPAAHTREQLTGLGHRRVRRPRGRRPADHHDPGRVVPLGRGQTSRPDADLTTAHPAAGTRLPFQQAAVARCLLVCPVPPETSGTTRAISGFGGLPAR